MHMHRRVQGVRVEANVVLELEEGVDSGAHRRASAGGDSGRVGAALSCARANAREEGVGGVRRRLGTSLGPAGWPAAAHAARARRARNVCAPARRCCRDAVAGPALGRGATWPGVGEGSSMHPRPTASAYDRKYAGRVGNAEARRRRDVAARARGRSQCFRVALFNWLKQ
jgi:hypothetical protein